MAATTFNVENIQTQQELFQIDVQSKLDYVNAFSPLIVRAYFNLHSGSVRGLVNRTEGIISPSRNASNETTVVGRIG